MSDLPTGPRTPTSTGLEPNVAGALSYLFMPIGGIVFFLIEKEDGFVRFHAAQSIVAGIGLIGAWIAFSILSAILGMIPILGALVAMLIWAGLSLGGLAVWLLLTLRAFQGREWEVPIAGEYARKLLASPATNA